MADSTNRKQPIDKEYLITAFKDFDEKILSIKYSDSNKERGKSAYEIAVDNGFEGTEQEFITSLKGNSGDSPTIGKNNNWFIGDEDTGVSAVPNVTIESGNWYINGKDSETQIPKYTDILRYVDKTVGLQDTPIGHIISFIGSTAPDHYLACDGTVYNISDYPELANHFAADFGNVGYFGGDGTSTFAVPDLRGEFLRGSGENYHSGNGNGEDVGIHQDATKHTSVFVSKAGSLLIGSKSSVVSSNLDTSINATGRRWTSLESNSNDSTLIYYTARPTNTSVLFCIKSEPTFYMDFSGTNITINGEVSNIASPVSKEDIKHAVGDYLVNNPPRSVGATAAQIEQIQNNTNEINNIKSNNESVEITLQKIQADTDYILMMQELE